MSNIIFQMIYRFQQFLLSPLNEQLQMLIIILSHILFQIFFPNLYLILNIYHLFFLYYHHTKFIVFYNYPIKLRFLDSKVSSFFTINQYNFYFIYFFLQELIFLNIFSHDFYYFLLKITQISLYRNSFKKESNFFHVPSLIFLSLKIDCLIINLVTIF
jgi:hypothetical protein